MGIKIKMIKLSNKSISVDTKKDKIQVERILKKKLNEKNSTLLITGGTGSFGKAVLNKYLKIKILKSLEYSVEMKKNKT